MRAAILAIMTCWIAAAPTFGAPAAERTEQCLACHGSNGRSELPEIPSLGGQPSLYVTFQLLFFREKQRKNEVMNDQIKDFSDDDLQQFAEFISKLPPPKPAADEAIDTARFEHGKTLAGKAHCGFCHNNDLSGRDQMPRLAGQREEYLRKALGDYKTGARVGSSAAMAGAIAGLADDDLNDLAYFAAHFH
jgi:cytochrome c553